MARPQVHRPSRPSGKTLADGHPLARLMQRNGLRTQATGALPAEAQALYGRALESLQVNALFEALALVDGALALAPQQHQLLQLKAAVLVSLHRLDEADALWQQLLARRPKDPQLLSNMGLYALRQRRHGQALDLLTRAVALEPRHATSQLNLGIVHAAEHRYDQAMACYRAALREAPRDAEIHFSIGCCLQAQHRLPEAHAAYEQALAVDASHAGAGANLVFTQHYLPDFDPAANCLQAERTAAALTRKAPGPQLPPAHPGGLEAGKRPLRVGLVSPDLNIHPVGFFLEAMLAALPPGEVVLHAYANSRVYDALSERLRPAFAVWRQVIDGSNAELMQAVVNDGIDILIDLAGYTKGNSLACFAHRLAPVQMGWLGYFSTTGMATMDCVLADAACVPHGEERFFTEKVIRLPHTRYCFSPLKTPLAERILPSVRNGFVTFGCYQALPKINARVLQAWARVLAAAPTARLRIRSAQLRAPAVATAFRERLEHLGLPADRVDVLPPLEYDAYLQSHADVDVLLDTFPYPGGTTTAEALYLGVPTLTLALPGMLGRQGEAVLKNGGLGHWVCADEADYVAKASALAQAGSTWLAEAAALRAQAPAHVASSPLYDAGRFARDWLDALRAAWDRTVAEGLRGPRAR